MPDQPDDPINYDMKIPPEKIENKSQTQRGEHGSGEAAAKSNAARQKRNENEENSPELPSE
ncbi:MAG TPA: hypothetical protein VG267_20550 [Terracidiphilus sp.]|jgi:hypothetical protein|nr:hypothetical protein [Terracidiphilus sp.]